MAINQVVGSTLAVAANTAINTDTPVANEGTQQYQDLANNALTVGDGNGNLVDPNTVNTGGSGNGSLLSQVDTNPNVGLETAQDIVNDPTSFLTPDMQMSNQVPTIDGTDGMMDPNASYAQGDAAGLNIETTTADAQTIQTTPENPGATTYDAVDTFDDVVDAQGTAAVGELSEEAIIEAEQIDAKGTATGINSDGTKNYTGEALTQFASQSISTMIDTSTVAGKLLAQELGEGNYTDTKATVMGQLDIISQQFTGPDGEAVIPSWAQSTARNVSRIAAFKGMSGTAATAALSTAIMEATLPIAQQEAQFFQTVTLTNLDNKQTATINRANVLAKMDQLNLDARMQTAIENSKAFLAIDLKNLDNEQQMAVINTQARVQSILEDAKSENAARMFAADAANDFQKFYDELGASISKFNVEQMNSMAKFNAGEINDTREFNATLENRREEFYNTMQYNIDLSNAKWRQEITMAEAEMAYEAAALDVKNLFDITTEAQSRLWDRADALLDYSWKSSESALDREMKILVAQIDAASRKSTAMDAIGKIVGNWAGSQTGSELISSVGGKVLEAGKSFLVGKALPFLKSAAVKIFSFFSDERLKEDVVEFATLSNGIKIYRWKWSEEAKELVGDQPAFGVIAQEVQEIMPDAVTEGPDGYLRVNYGMIVQ